MTFAIVLPKKSFQDVAERGFYLLSLNYPSSMV